VLEPIVKKIEVPCGQAKAFKIFIEEMETWWPMDKFTVSVMAGGKAAGIRVEAKAGGKIIEVSADGTEYYWGTIKSYDPYSGFAMDFHIPHPDHMPCPPDHAGGGETFVELSFVPMEGNRTLVQLTQSNFEALGEMAVGVHGGYGGGWNMIFIGAYAQACAA